MTPEQRLLACANMSSFILEVALAGKRYREENPKQTRP
jgi:hypothetical protein